MKATEEMMVDNFVKEHEKGRITWEVKDRYSEVRANRIFTPEGEPTGFSMVYGKQGDLWIPRCPVSDHRYTPVSTQQIVDLIKERLTCKVRLEKIKYDRGNTKVQIDLVMDEEAVKIPGVPFDRGSRWADQGDQRLRNDIMRPMVRVINSYDGSHAVSARVGLWRQVCSNGMIVAVPGASIHRRKIHTVWQIEDLIRELATINLAVKEQGKIVRQLTKKVLSQGEVEAILKRLPQKYQEEGKECLVRGKNTGFAALTFLTYLQQHVYTVTRSEQVNPTINTLVRLAA